MYQILGSSQYGRELIDEFDTMAEAEKNLAEYRLAFGPGWSLWIEE